MSYFACVSWRQLSIYSYNHISRSIRELAAKIHELDAKDGFRVSASARLLHKLYDMGIIMTRQSLEQANKVCNSENGKGQEGKVRTDKRQRHMQKATIGGDGSTEDGTNGKDGVAAHTTGRLSYCE